MVEHVINRQYTLKFSEREAELAAWWGTVQAFSFA